MASLTDLTKVATRPALERLSAARDEHQHTHDPATLAPHCTCGWAPKRAMRYPRNAVGLHIAAAEKRAEKAYDAECEPIITLLVRKDVAQLIALVDSLQAADVRAHAADNTAAQTALQAQIAAAIAVLSAHAELGDALAAAQLAYYARVRAQADLHIARQTGASDAERAEARQAVAAAITAEAEARQALTATLPKRTGPSPEAVRTAVARLQAELTANADAIGRVLSEPLPGEAEWMDRLAAQTDEQAAAEGWVAEPRAGHPVDVAVAEADRTL